MWGILHGTWFYTFYKCSQKRDAEDLFDFRNDGTLSVILSLLNNEVFKSFYLVVKFDNGWATITTDVGIGITEINRKTMNVLMKCLNNDILGYFFISEKRCRFLRFFTRFNNIKKAILYSYSS